LSYADILQDTLEYIDAHLGEELDLGLLAARAGFSPYHFIHVFRFGVGYTVMDYVRRRRLAFAAAELSSDRRILDIALEYGFETHSGFSRAFRRHYGCSPETYRTHAHTGTPELPSLSHIKKYNTGGIVMEPKFVTRPAFKIAGYSIRTKNTDGQNSTDIPAFWGRYIQDGRCDKMHKENFLKSHTEYGASCFAMEADGSFLYAIGCEPKDGAAIPEGYEVFEIPAATYAVFSSPPADGAGFTASIQGTWGYIFNEWFPKSGYEYAEGGADFELYDERCVGETGKVCDIYIPVSKKG
jgi:AraC family transcriptional regulator